MPELWQKIRTQLREEMGESSFAEHFGSFFGMRTEGGALLLQSSDEIRVLIARKNYSHLVSRIAEAHAGAPIDVRITYDPAAHAPRRDASAPAPTPASAAYRSEPASAVLSFDTPTVDAQTAASPHDQLSLFGDAPAAATSNGPGGGVEFSASYRARDAAFVARAPHPHVAPGHALPGHTAPGHALPGHSAPAYIPPAPDKVTVDRAIRAAGLQPHLCFDSFVVGAGSEFAHSAAESVVEEPGARFNPLFIYGGVGLGKTHLLNAVGVAALRIDPTLRVRYLSGESFVNELIESIKLGRMGEFRARNRQNIDLLLVDDIQFIVGKEKTQEEFFHTFNALHSAGRQIVITSDRVPQDMAPLEERIRSRLHMGLLVDVQPPDLETRVAILRRRATQMRYNVPQDVLVYIAENVRTNVRELYGALLNVGSYCKLRRVPISLDIAREQLAAIHRGALGRVTLEDILAATSEYCRVRPDEILGRRRTARIANPRKLAMYLGRTHTRASFPELGRFFGKRDHTTVLSACRSIEEQVEVDIAMRATVAAIESKLGLR